MSIDLAHWDYTLLIYNYDPLATYFVAPFDHVKLELFEALLEFDNSLVRAEASLLVRADVHGVVSPLEINKELLTPSDRAVPLHVPEHLFHPLLLFVMIRQHHFAQVLGNIIEIKWVDKVRAIQLAGAARELR